MSHFSGLLIHEHPEVIPNSSMALEIPRIRAIAEMYGYMESDYNSESKLISFKKGSTRINVYYTTGTVGTCLNHPKRGKTQLFRRNVTIDQLEEIFDNPRIHTDTGYYRKHITQKWKRSSSTGDNSSGSDDHPYMTDSAMRWRYVGRVTGLIQSDKHMKDVCDICTKFDGLLFDDLSMPDIRKTRYGCGSRCALMRFVFIAYKMKFGEFQIKENKKDEFQSFEGIPLEDLNDGLCETGFDFLRDHGSQMTDLLKMITVLPSDIAFELMSWFLGRDMQKRFADLSNQQKKTPFSDSIESAHIEYGEMMYPKKAKLCAHCGIKCNDK